MCLFLFLFVVVSLYIWIPRRVLDTNNLEHWTELWCPQFIEFSRKFNLCNKMLYTRSIVISYMFVYYMAVLAMPIPCIWNIKVMLCMHSLYLPVAPGCSVSFLSLHVAYLTTMCPSCLHLLPVSSIKSIIYPTSSKVGRYLSTQIRRVGRMETGNANFKLFIAALESWQLRRMFSWLYCRTSWVKQLVQHYRNVTH